MMPALSTADDAGGNTHSTTFRQVRYAQHEGTLEDASTGRPAAKHHVDADPTEIDSGESMSSAMAWGSSRHTFIGNRTGGEPWMAQTDLDDEVRFNNQPLFEEFSTPTGHAIGVSRCEVLLLPDKIIYQPYSHVPLVTVNLTIWQDRLSTESVKDLVRRNANFSRLILRRVRRRRDEILPLITKYFGGFVIDIVSGSSVVDDSWLRTFGTECPAMKRLAAARCRGVTSKGIGAIACKKGRGLRALDVAGCEKVSDDGVEILAKHCTHLQSIDLSGCCRVRDRSVYAISKLTRLQHIALDSCAEVTDEAFFQLAIGITQLKSLSIKGCSSITEEGLRFMREMPVPWGTREHQNFSNLETLRVGQNSNISDEFIIMVVGVCPKLRTLEVSACPLVCGDEAMGMLGILQELIDVTLEALPRVSDEGIRQFFSDLPRRALQNLSLVGCTKVTDVSLKCIAENARDLRQLRLDKNVCVTDRGLGYLAKGLIALRLLQATHLRMVTDESVRLIARKCFRLTDLDCSHCLHLSASCLPMIRRLRGLEVLGLSSCNDLFRGGGDESGYTIAGSTAFDAIEFYKLRELRLSQNSHLTDEALRCVAMRNCRTLQSLDISHCSVITAVGVLEALRVLSELKRLDVTGCELLKEEDVEDFARCVDQRLLLSCARRELDGFDGLHCSASAEDARERRDLLRSAHREVIAAQIIQRAFRRFRQREEENKEASRERNELMWAATIIQGLARGFIVRQRLCERSTWRPRLMLSVFKWRRRTKESLGWKLASHHEDRVLLLRVVWEWRAFVIEELVGASDLVERGDMLFKQTLMKTHLRAWVRFMAPTRAKESTEDGRAHDWWCERTRRTLFHRWRDHARKIVKRRSKMIEIMLYILPTEFQNSSRQKPKVECALMFHRRRALRRAWKTFLGLKTELAELQRRFKQFDDVNRPRRLYRNFARLHEAVTMQQKSRCLKHKADMAVRVSRQRRGLRFMSATVAAAVSARSSRVHANEFSKKTLKIMAVKTLRESHARKKVLRTFIRAREERAAGHHAEVLRRKGLRILQERVRQRVIARIEMAKAASKFVAGTKKICFMAWKLHYQTLKNAAENIRAGESRRLLMRVFNAWATCPVRSPLTRSQSIDHDPAVVPVGEVSGEEERQLAVDKGSPPEPMAQTSDQDPCGGITSAAESEPVEKSDYEVVTAAIIEYSPESDPAAVVIQAAWRGFMARRRYVEERTTRQWAVVKVQSFFRARKARKLFSKQTRYKRNREAAKAEEEANLMAIAEEESHSLREYHKALFTLERIIWGYRGRKLARERRHQARREEVSRRFALKEEALRRHEETLKRLEILRKDKEKSATLMQAAWGRKMARIRVEGIREDNRRRRAAIMIQCMIRFRAARHEAAARNRQRGRTAYVHRGRKGQARLLRMIRLMHRRSQRPAVRLLRKAGADLMGFTTSLEIQRMELIRDYRLARQELDMHIEAFRVGGRHAFRRHNIIRAHQLGDLERKRVRRGDAVKILDRAHEFCGFTGRILHVDTRDPGRDLAEVKLDDGTGRVVYVRLLTPANEKDSIPQVNMLKIDRDEIIQHNPAELALVRVALLDWADRERGWWSLHLAAIAIQRRIRGYLARRSTARWRHRYWTNERAIRLVFLRGLDVANVATYQAVRGLVNLRAIKPTMVPTNMPWVPPVPPRLDKVFKQRRHRAILEEEVRTRIAERAHVVAQGRQKLQWKAPTHGPLIRPHHPIKEVWERTVSCFSDPSVLPGIFHSLAGGSFSSKSLELKTEERKQARTVYTRGFQFIQLEESPHVRTSGRAMFHGSWVRSKCSALDDADSHLSSSSVSDLANGKRKDSRSHCHQNGKGEILAERGGKGKRLAIREPRRRVSTGEQHPQAAAKPLRFAWGFAKKQRGDDRGGGRGGNAIEKNEVTGKRKMEKKHDKTITNKQNQKGQTKKWSRRSASVIYVPHGEGYVEFLDGWGVSQEEKTLYVTVVGSKGLAETNWSILGQHCNPFFKLMCNDKSQYTSTKHKTREPRYNERFEFDVSNPASFLKLECWDEDALLLTYLGGTTLPLGDFSNGEKVRKWYLLSSAGFRGESKRDPFKRKSKGRVELELQWLPKETEDNVSISIRLSKSVLLLQCWVRTILARRAAADAATEARLKAEFAFAVTFRIQMCWRRYSAREKLRVRKMYYRNARILQKCIRRKLAYMKAIWERTRRDKSIAIQCFVRQQLAHGALSRMREEKRILERDMASRIQAKARGKLTRRDIVQMRQTIDQANEGTQHSKAKIPLAKWLPTFGTDPYYASRRIRRITERAYYKVLGISGSVVETRFGTATVLQYPASVCAPKEGAKKGAVLRDPERFVEVKWNAHADLHWPRPEREAISKEAPRCYRGFFELVSVPADRTVGRRITSIQCAVRTQVARRALKVRRRRHDAANVIQTAYRRYHGREETALRKLQSVARGYIARRKCGRLAQEKRCAIIVQCAYRSRKARLAAAYKRVIRTTKVTGSSGCSDPLYGPENCVVLEPSEESTLWSSPYEEVDGQWIAFDLGKDLPVGAMRLLAMSNTACPKMVHVECRKTEKRPKDGDWTLVGSFQAANQAVWQQFEIPRMLDGTTVARRWKVTFASNYGNTTAVAAHGIQFLLAKEESPRVLSQSHSTMVTPPPVGKGPWNISLNVEGTAWPPHQYQWYRNGQPLEGERLSKLKIRLSSPPSRERWAFKCIHCKHAKDDVPRNVARVICGNCETPFTLKEHEDTYIARSTWEQEVLTLESAVIEAKEVVDKVMTDRDEDHLEAFLCEKECKRNLTAAKEELKRQKATLTEAEKRLRSAREEVNKKHKEFVENACDDPLKARHDFEGVYECHLSNIRGGSIVRTVSSHAIYVSAREPPPLRLEVKVKYVPKQKLRRRYWPKYDWAFGWFVNGEIGGEILIKFHDGAIYDGPYVHEACLDLKGSVPPEAREPGHWGKWITKSGWKYEGPSVDNHFDIDSISGIYRLTTPVGEVYEGEILDEENHGMGEYRYADGTVYTGEWHRGQRQGFGTLVSPDGSTYEGEFDHDMIHGEGLWFWPDGSSHAGRASHGVREGKGLYVTEMRDSFYGEFQESKPHGEGIARYCDGSSYVGQFTAGKRHGKGTLENASGVCAIGTWSSDKRDGVFELRTPVVIPELQETQDEIRTGLWEEGEFAEWLSPPIYPYATMQFYEMFEKDDSEYDGVYAMLVAKKLPNLPRGVDPKNPRVMACARRIAAEAGELCASESIRDAKKQIAELEIPYDVALSRLQAAESPERVCCKQRLEKKEVVDNLAKKAVALEDNRDKLEAEVEQFFADDPGKTKELFLQAVARLKTIPAAEWFMIRTYDKPPPALAAVMSAACTVMLVTDTWKSARNLVGSSVQNMKEGDEEAMYTKYDCKLVHRLETEFSPYTRCDASDVMLKLASFAVDPRFERDSMFLKLYGEALGPVADTVKRAYKYIVKAAEIKPKKMAIAGVEANVKYTSICLERERQELEELDKQVQQKNSKREEAQATEAKARIQLDKARAMLKEAQDLVVVYVPPRGQLDPYERLEANLDPELTEVEVVLELLVLQVETRLEEKNKEVVLFEIEPFFLNQIEEHVSALIEKGIYTFTAGTVQCHDDSKVARVKSDAIINECKRGINTCLKDTPPEKGEWTMLQGQTVHESSLNTILDTRWDHLLSEKALAEAVKNWALAFPGEGEAAYQVLLLSVSNEAMSDERKAEAQLWSDNNVDDVVDMTWRLASQFAEQWPDNTVEGCIQVLHGNDYGADIRLQANAWEKHNPGTVREYRAEFQKHLADGFAAMWGSGAEAARQVIVVRETNDQYQGAYAEAWASFHVAEMVAAEGELAKSRSKAFEDRYPEDTATKAVRIMAAHGIEAAPAHDNSEEMREALSWCAMHARATSGAEENLALKLANDDAKAAMEQEALERRLERVLENRSGEDSQVDHVTLAEGALAPTTAHKQSTSTRKAARATSSTGAMTTSLETVTDVAKGQSKADVDTAVRGGKGGKSRSPNSLKFAEKREAERKAKEEEEQKRRREAEAAEDALRNRPKRKDEQLTELLASKLAERLKSCGERLVLLRRAKEKADADDSPERVLGDSTTKPSERQSKYETLLEERRKILEHIEVRIADVEAKAEQVRTKLETTGVDLNTLLGSAASRRAGEGWASYLDEESGLYYWYNDLTGEAHYDG